MSRNRSIVLFDKFRILVIYCCLVLGDNAWASSYSYLEGNLETYLKTLDYGKKGDNIWIKPSPEYRSSFAQMFDLFVASDYAGANRLGGAIGYQIIEYVDSGRTPTKTHYILQETSPLGSKSYKGAGIFVLKLGGRPVAIEAPHPKSDMYTGLQAIELYLNSSSGFLFIASSHRNSSTSFSRCSGNYFASDPVHNTAHTYYIAHKQLAQSKPHTLFIQLHGFGASSLAKLQTQCQTNNDKLINLSTGLKYLSNAKTNRFIDILSASINSTGKVKACIYGTNTGSLGGTRNTTGRFSNNSVDPCTTGAIQANHQFIHIEQSFPIRSSYRTSINKQFTNAINTFFQ